MFNHIVNQIHHSELRSSSTLHVIGVISNPVRYHSRYRIARKWIMEMHKTPNICLHIVEGAFGDRHHELKELCETLGVDFIPLYLRSEAWVKESMINVGVRSVIVRYNPRYLAWVDADVFFRCPGWALETIHQLQHYQIVQPWTDAMDLGPAGTVLEHHKSFGFIHASGIKQQRYPTEPYKFGHPGFAWACTRAFWEATGGLMEFPILGSADHHMAWALVGEPNVSVHYGMSDSFKRLCHEWSKRATRVCESIVGFVQGRVEHEFHGPKKRRYYRERWQILMDHKYDPDRDLMHDEQGLVRLVNKPGLEEAIRRYNRSRMEDSIEE